MKKLLIFDLDGTTLYTLPSIALTCNLVMASFGLPERALGEYPRYVGSGVREQLRRVFAANQVTASEEQLQEALDRYLALFSTRYDHEVTVYAGVGELLEQLQGQGWQLAILSNKPQEMTVKLMAEFFPNIKFTAVFGQRNEVPLKPDPCAVDEILALAACAAQEAILVGDSRVDMLTARNAGLSSVGVLWGYGSRAELEETQATYLVATVAELAELLPRLAAADDGSASCCCSS